LIVRHPIGDTDNDILRLYCLSDLYGSAVSSGFKTFGPTRHPVFQSIYCPPPGIDIDIYFGI